MTLQGYIESAHREGLFSRKIVKISFSYLMNRITKCIASSGLISVTSVHQHTKNGNADNTNQLGSVLFQCKESSFVKVLRWQICDELPSAENVGVILIYHNRHSGRQECVQVNK